MSITVTGELLTPIGNTSSNTHIRTTSQISLGNTLKSSFAVYVTSDVGIYNFELEEGLHLVEVMFDDTYIPIGSFIVNSATPSPIALAELIKYSTPIVPIPVIPEDPNWDALFTRINTLGDTVKQTLQEQVADDNIGIVELKTSWQNPSENSNMASEENQTLTGVVSSSKEVKTYSDANANQSVSEVVSQRTGYSELDTEASMYRASNGNVDVTYSYSFTNGALSYSNSVKGTNEDNILGSEVSEVGDAKSQTDKVTSDVTGGLLSSIIDNLTNSNSALVRTLSNAYTASVATLVDRISMVVGPTSSTIENTTKVDETEHAYTTDVDGKSGSYKLTNDGTTTKAEFLVDEFRVGTTFNVTGNRVNITGQLVLSDGTQIDGINDIRGPTGDTIFEVYEYSIDGATDWHTTHQSGDLWRRTATSTNGVLSPFSLATQFGSPDGLAGDTIYVDFTYSIDGIDNWHFPFVDGDAYQRNRIVTNNVPAGWSVAGRIIGADGEPGDTVFIEYEYSIDGLSLWHTNFDTGDHYIRSRLTTNGTPDIWSAAGKIVPLKGIDYSDGESGPGQYYLTNPTGSFPSDVDATAEFTAYVGRPPLRDDHLTYTNPTRTSVEIKRYDGINWVAPAMIIHGDLLVQGTITGDRMVANTITGDQIAANSITAAEINTTNLSALSANLGTVTTGVLQSVDGQFVIDLNNKSIYIS